MQKILRLCISAINVDIRTSYFRKLENQKKKWGDIKMKNRQRKDFRIITIILVLIGLVIVAILLKYPFKTKTIDNQEEVKEWLSDNCVCIERNNFGCAFGFELKGSSCFNETTTEYTNRIILCSKYNCDDVIYTFDNNTKKWEN